MERILTNIYNILAMNGSILIIPGVNFLLVVKHSLLSGFSHGFRCAAGITTAIMLHVILSILSISILLKNYPSLFSAIRYGGACYLLYLGTRFLISAFKKNMESSSPSDLNINKTEAFRSGFLVDLLNPFVSIFYLSLFSTLMITDGSISEIGFYGVTIFIITLGWFSLVAGFFARVSIQRYFKNKKHYIQILSGVAMYYFSVKVIFGF